MLVEAAEHFHRYGRDYFGSYFFGVDTAALVVMCGHFLDAYRAVDERRPEAAPVCISRIESGFHLVADDGLSDLTDSGLRELAHSAEAEGDLKRHAMLTAMIAKSWPVEILRESAERGCSDEPTDEERAETQRAFAELARLDIGQLQEQVRRLKKDG
ncbi:hypothetical protein [Methylocapsa sp. S129]|uniref:hypothetical protein n=1 Tax=Methylocapsa sp. S129 TaxID=1641869 RepID=UPI00131C6F3E|nr:hypothetical protein [Methylocapsa sp. S129]